MDTQDKKEKELEPVADAAPQPETAPVSMDVPAKERTSRAPRERRQRGGGRGGRSRASREVRREYDQRILTIRRVSRTVAGGRRFNFSVAIVIGDKKGKVGVGLGKAGDTSLAIDKSVRDAKKNMLTVPLTKDSSIAHETRAKYAASRVALSPSPHRGLIAGSSVRPVLELAGVTNVIAKIHSGSKNKLNNARAAIKALSLLKP